MSYKLAISDIVKFQVKLTVNDAGVKKDFSLWLEANRIDLETMETNLEERGDLKVVDFQRKTLRENLTNWSDQRLVLDQNNHPADFSPEARDLMLNLAGAVPVIHAAYMDAIAASAGPVGRLKNS